MAGTMTVPRSRGVFSGAMLVLLALWGGLLPFVGPYADFGFAPDDPWVYDTDRLQLSVAPAIATGLGGLIVLSSAHRAFAMFGAWLAVLGGAWFVVGGPVATLWDVPGVGAPLGTEEGRRLAEQLSGFSALGLVIVFFAALALGRFAVVGVKEARYGEDDGEPDDDGRWRVGGEGPAGWESGGYTGESRDRAAPGGSGTTQPMAPAFGRYSRGSAAEPPPPGPPGPVPDQRVAGERGERQDERFH